MLKRHFFIIAAAAVLAMMTVAVILRIVLADSGDGMSRGLGGRGAQAVSQTLVSPRNFNDSVDVLGVARGRRSVEITSATTQLITRVMFTDGQAVSAGTPLVELQAAEQDAGVIQAQANVDQARRDLERWQALADRGVAPRVTAEQARTSLDVALAGLRAAEARRGDRLIKAPFDGVLGLSTVTPGTLINPGALITTLDDISVIRVDFPVPERYLATLSAGTPIIAHADAFPGQTFTGHIALLDTRVDERTRAVTARAEFANPSGRIRPGMAMRVSIQQGERQGAAVPEAAIQYEGDSAFVYRIVTQGDHSSAQRVVVSTGAVQGGYVEILSGVGMNDRVVSSGLNRIQPGAPVTAAQTRQAEAGSTVEARS